MSRNPEEWRRALSEKGKTRSEWAGKLRSTNVEEAKWIGPVRILDCEQVEVGNSIIVQTRDIVNFVEICVVHQIDIAFRTHRNGIGLYNIVAIGPHFVVVYEPEEEVMPREQQILAVAMEGYQ